MILGKKYYDLLPVWLQNIAVNIKSSSTFKEKYSSYFHKFMETLARNELKSRDQLLSEQAVASQALLRYALENIPYYRNQGYSSKSLQDWPILQKKKIVLNADQFLSDEFSSEQLMSLHTSGTTGTPLRVRFSQQYHAMEMAFRWRHKAWANIKFLSPSAYISGHPVVPSNQKNPPFWRWDRVEKRLLCSSYHLKPDNLPYYVEAFIEHQPKFFHGYPSSLYVLAQHIVNHGINGVRPKAVFSASETLLDFQRTVIEKAFGTKVYNWYGNTEMTCNIVECAAGNLHYRTDYGLLELLDDGTMICTGLNNFAMPLIRYQVGDIAIAKKGECSCGVSFPMIERITGRVEDYVKTPDGRVIGRLDHLFKDVNHVKEAQIVQNVLEELVLRIVCADGYGPQDERIIVAEAQQRLGNSVKLKFDYVDNIERTSNGKFRFIVSNLPK